MASGEPLDAAAGEPLVRPGQGAGQSALDKATRSAGDGGRERTAAAPVAVRYGGSRQRVVDGRPCADPGGGSEQGHHRHEYGQQGDTNTLPWRFASALIGVTILY